LAPALERGSMEVINELAYPLPATVICELIGIPPGERDRNRSWGEVVATTVDPLCTNAQIAVAESAMREWDAYLREFMISRRRAPGDALIDALLAVEDDGSRLTDDEIAANMTFLFLAGHATTTGLIGNGLYALLRHPAQLAKLHAEPALVENAIEELLRFDSPVQFAPRVAIAQTEIDGITIEPEIPVNLVLGSANRDPARYDRPDELDVTRPDPKPLSFGGGPHFCVGAALARFEAKAAFDQLVTRTRALALVNQPQFRPGLALRSLVELAITIQR
jgi:cytochrome P450